MSPQPVRRAITLVLCLSLLALASVGADEPSCQPVEPGQPVCLTAIDCDGLVPDVNCLGDWTCVEATCVWACEGSCTSNDDCMTAGDASEYCAKDSCDSDGGVCSPRPEMCPALWAPVCGCDGNTYGNTCSAAASGVNVMSEGDCETQPADCENNDDCQGDPMTDPAFAAQYCAKELGDCDGDGQCTDRPTICPSVWAPVCGCDGETYGNSCTAATAGVSVAAAGECASPAYCWANDMCDDDEYCFFAVCAQETGSCLPRPQGCYYLYDPVCGCDGETYSNDCLAATAGVSIDYAGTCAPEPTHCWEDEMCAPGEFCELAGCDAKSGWCSLLPDACYELYAPVCACNGVTYGNDCFAAGAGQTIDHEGECKE